MGTRRRSHAEGAQRALLVLETFWVAGSYNTTKWLRLVEGVATFPQRSFVKSVKINKDKKSMKKKISIIALLALAVAGGAIVAYHSVSAANAATTAGATAQSVNIGPQGNVSLRGSITAISGSSWTVASWGGAWTVDVSGATVAPKGSTSTITSFSVGDNVVVNGTASASGLTVTAKTVAEATSFMGMGGGSAGGPGKMGGFGGGFRGARADMGTISDLDTSTGSFTLTPKTGSAVTIDTTSATTVTVGTTTSSLAALANGMYAFVIPVQGSSTSSPITAAKIIASTNPPTFPSGGGPGMMGHGRFGRKPASTGATTQ